MTDVSSTNTKVPPLVGTLPPQCRRDVDTLRRFVHTAISQGSPGDPVSPADFREVLLTGATGFIGRFLLRDLLRQNADLVVHCLVQADKVGHGFERLRDALRRAEIWDEAFAPRIRVVVGDVTEIRFGLSEADFEDLCQRIDAVYHLAADLTLASPYLTIRKANTFSIRNVLELCLRTRYKHVFFTSSMSVFPQYFFAFGNEFRDCRIDHQMQPDLASMKRMYPLGIFGYPWSKLATEQVLLFAQSAGLPVGIFRFPRTSAASTGPAEANDITVRLLSAVILAGMIPRGTTTQRGNETVDTLSRILAEISMNPRRRFTIYHCCDPEPVQQDVELADFGLDYSEVPYETFKRASQALGEESPLYRYWALIDHVAPYWFRPGSRAQAVLPICDRAMREDCPSPIRWPSSLRIFKNSNEWIRRHRKEWPYPIPKCRLDYDHLIARAGRYAENESVSFEQTYPTWMRRNLRQLVRDLQASDVKLLEDKLLDVVFNLSRLLRNNAALARERQQYPEIEREEITRPVFIVGINRTGTTYLHRLMSRDERFWALRSYEYAAPTLSKSEYATIGGTPGDPRRARAEEMLNASGIIELFEGVHDFDTNEPAEDFPILSMTFGAWTSTVRYHVPEFGRWLDANGSQDAYAFHRRTMQQYTWQRRQRQPEHQVQWLFKMPFHLMELETLVKTYPDALFIQTHREPTQFMGSWNSFVERVRSLFSEPRPRESLGTELLDFMSGMMERAVHFRETHPELESRWMDVNYVDLIEDPFRVVRNIYQHFGWTLEQAALDAMEEWQFRQAKKRRGEKRHRYDLKDYGLTPESVNAAFKRYRDFLTTRGIRVSGG